MIRNNWLLAVFVVLRTLVVSPAIAVEPVPAQSDSGWLHEIRTGVLAHDVDRLWSGSRKEGGVDFNVEIILDRPKFLLLQGTVHPNFGLSVNSRGDTSKLYGGFLWEFETITGFFLNVGLGAAVHDGKLDTKDDDKKELGSRVLFRIPIEIGYALNNRHRISIMFDHVSNAHLANPNEGLDTLGLRCGYRF